MSPLGILSRKDCATIVLIAVDPLAGTRLANALDRHGLSHQILLFNEPSKAERMLSGTSDPLAVDALVVDLADHDVPPTLPAISRIGFRAERAPNTRHAATSALGATLIVGDFETPDASADLVTAILDAWHALSGETLLA